MKRFLAISIVLFIVMLNVITNGATNKKIQKDSTYFSKIDKKDIYIAEDGEWEKVNLIGVNLDPAKPGVFPSENSVSEDEYIRWIGYIYDMGANCIKVPNLMSQHFYNALEKFNENKEKPIYLLQGIYFDETYLKDGYDPQSNKLREVFKANIKLILDSVHGNPYNFDKPDIIQFYNTDVSKYVIGYTLGIEFAKHDIIYTEIMNEDKSYKGEYFYTDDIASSFESYLAKMGDYLVDYELEMYKKQSLVGFIGSSSHYILSAKANPNGDNILAKDEDTDNYKDYIDPENIKSKKKLKTGTFASHNVYPSYTELKQYQQNLQSFFEKINSNHDIPVIIGEFGIPSSRSGGDFNENINNKGYINEQEQGEALVSTYNSIKEANIAGSFIFQFQDSWYSSSYNTKDTKILDRSAYWSDALTYSQSFGLMAFDPGNKKSVSYPDNYINEWEDKDLLNQDNNASLSVKSDEKYLYFMVKTLNKLDLENQNIYIDLDVTPKSGINKSSQYNLQFENDVDFILKINNKEDSAVLVHEYYNRFNFLKNEERYKIRPDIIIHTKDMDVFSPIYI